MGLWGSGPPLHTSGGFEAWTQSSHQGSVSAGITGQYVHEACEAQLLLKCWNMNMIEIVPLLESLQYQVFSTCKLHIESLQS